MKNLLQRIISLTMCVGLLCVGGCSDDDTTQISTEEALNEGAMDLTDGYNVFVWNVDNILNEELKLCTKHDVVVSDLDLGALQLNISEIDGQKHLTPSSFDVSKIDLPAFAEIELKVPDCKKLNKKVIIVLRPSAVDDKVVVADKTKADTNTEANQAEIEARALEIIGSGIDVCSDVGTITQGAFFDKNLIKPHVNATSAAGLTTFNFEHEGATQSSMQQTYSEQIGLSGKGAAYKTWMLSGSTAFSKSSSTYQQQYLEYYFGFSGSRMATASLDYVAMKSAPSNDDTKWHKGYLAYADKTIIDVLNNPNSAAYKQYDNSPEGIYDILDYYGTCVPTQLTLGAYAIGAYLRNESIYEHSISEDVDLEVSLRDSKSVGTGDVASILGYLRAKNGMNPGGSASYGYSFSDSEYLETTQAYKVGITKGGATSSASEYGWEATNTPTNWVAISYSIYDNQNDYNDPSSTFISILELTSHDEARCAALTEALTEDATGWAPYFSYKYKPVEVDEMSTRLVLADVMMKEGANGNQSGDPKPIREKGPDDVYRIYYPMMQNNYAPDFSLEGYAIETSRQYYVAAIDHKDHYWYYAVDHADKCNGIVDIIFAQSNDEGAQSYVQRGDNAHNAITGVIKDNYVSLDLGDENTPSEDKITGFGLAFTRDVYVHENFSTVINDELSVHKYEVFASTGGTEWARTQNPDDKDYFMSYWGSETSAFKGVTYHLEVEDWFYEGGLIIDRPFGPCYTKKSIAKRFVATGDGDIADAVSQPNVW